MKMKEILMGCMTIMLLCITACDDQLEIVPKGKTTLGNVSDLELLLNQEWALVQEPHYDLGHICNESLGRSGQASAKLTQKNTTDYAYLTFDESVDRAELATADRRYQAAYKYINYMNVVLEKIDDATGDATVKPSIKAEARMMRAYFHWLLVNIYAQQYDEATAADKGGVPYVTETNVSVQKTKLTLKETYKCILEDCADEVIDMLPESNLSHVLRPCKAFGNAVRAKVLMQMKRYAEALPYAQKALSLNGKIEDRSIIKTSKRWALANTCQSNYVYMIAGMRVNPTMETLSPETGQLFETGDYIVKYASSGWSASMGLMYSGINGAMYCNNWSVRGNAYGITSDRMYYTTAECLIRTGKIRDGLALVDKVRAFRVEDYEPFVGKFDQKALSEEEAMALLQKAKWIECLGSYENFFDCKRWNTEAKYKRTITRNLGELGTYTITPESPLWVFPFPANAVRYNPSLTQNY